MTTQFHKKAQKRSKKTLSLQLRQIISIETTYNNKNKNKKEKISKNPENPEGGRGSDFQSYHIIRLKCAVLNKKSQGIQRNRKVWPIQRKKNKPIETIPKEDLMEDILDKDFKTTALKMLKEL